MALPETRPRASIWDQLADRLNPGYERPRLRPGIVARQLTTAHGEPYYIVKNPEAGTYVRLTPEEYGLLGLMDGQHQVKDLVLAYFFAHRCLAVERIGHLVAQLHQDHFLSEEPRDAWGGLAAAIRQRTWTYRLGHLLKGFQYHEFPLSGLDPVITALYRWGGWICFTPPAVLVGGALSTIGIVLFIGELFHSTRDPLRFGSSYTVGLLVLLALWVAAISLHELGHALATKHFGGEVQRGGVMLYYGMPAFFTDTTDVWMQPRRARLIVSVAGIATMWGLGGLAMLYVLWQHGGALAPLAYQVAFVAFISNTLQLMPLLELDGYYVLVDWLEIPLLRQRAFAFIRGDLWRKLRRREHLSREERIFAVYGALALGYSSLTLCAAIYFWLHRFQRVLLDAWAQESVGWRLLAGLVLLAFGGPLLLAIGLQLRQLLRSGWMGLARLRYRGVSARAQARLDARELVGKLRFLHALPFAEREAVVSQLRLARFPVGAYVIRQGAPNNRFYVIRWGQAEVVQVDPAGGPRTLAVLRRGDYFGELGLLSDQPASASVRALQPLEVYALERPAFEARIAPRLRDYGVTSEWIEARAELARMPLFRAAAASELDALLERLQPAEYPTGAVIVQEGEPHDRFYLIRRGRVQLSVRGPDGQEAVIAELGPGMSFGEDALLVGSPCPATARALEPTLLWSLDQPSFQELLLRRLHLTEALVAETEQRTATGLRLAGQCGERGRQRCGI